MNNVCRQIAHSPSRRLCEAMGTTALDIGVPSIDYRRNAASPVVKGKGDGRITPAEVLYYALSHSPDAAAIDRHAAKFRQAMGVGIPWMPNARNRARLQKGLASMETRLRAQGIDRKHREFGIRLAAEINTWITKGLGMKYRSHRLAEGDIDVIMKRRYFHCNEFAILFYGIARLAGIEVIPVEIHQEAFHHAAIAVANPSGGHHYFDGELGRLTHAPYLHYYFTGANDLFSAHLHNRAIVGTTKRGRMSRTRIPLLHLALQASPENAHVLFALGVYHHARDEYEKAEPYYRKAHLRRPNDRILHSRYCLVRLLAGKGICK